MLMAFVCKFQYTLFSMALSADYGGFDDLGLLLFGGLALAICIAVLFSVIRLRMQDKKETSSDYLSISASRKDK